MDSKVTLPQRDPGLRVGLTQRAIEEVWRQEGIEFEDLADGGFRVSIRSSLLDRPAAVRRRAGHLDLGVTRIRSDSAKHRV
jgi:hypothetical protein